MEKIIAQILGCIAIVVTVIALQLNKKNRILILHIISNSLYLIQYYLLKAFTASSTSLIAIFRSIIFFYYDKKKKNKSKLVLFIILTLILLMSIITYHDMFSIVALCASSLYTVGIWQNNLKVFRKIALIVPILWFIYNFHVCAYVSMFASCMEFSSALIAIIRLDILKRDRNNVPN